MKKLAFASAIVLGLVLATTISVPTFAAEQKSDGKNCTIKTVQPNRGTPMSDLGGDKKFTKSAGRAYIKVTVTGDKCSIPVSLVAWKADSLSGKPYKQQELAWYNNRTLKEGTVTMSIPIPKCYFQIDLVRGSNPRGIDGGGAYQDGRMIHSVHGGTKKCDQPETPVTPDTPDTPVTPETPETPVTPETPETPATPATPATEVTSLPKTGPGMAVAIAGGVSVLSAGAHAIFTRRRLL